MIEKLRKKNLFSRPKPHHIGTYKGGSSSGSPDYEPPQRVDKSVLGRRNYIRLKTVNSIRFEWP